MATGNRMRARAKAQMPMVLLTLLSIIQALALELLWSHIEANEVLLTASWLAVLSWVQVGAMLLTILLIWMLYSSMVMRFRWVPSPSDSLFPFLVGILQFTLVALLGPEHLGYWFAVLALLFGITASAIQLIMRQARRDPENAAFFAHFAPATLRDFYPIVAIMGVFLLCGAALGSSGHQGPFALVALLIALIAIGQQMRVNVRYWQSSMRLGDSSDN